MGLLSTTSNADPVDLTGLAARWGLTITPRSALGDAPALLVGREGVWLRVGGRTLGWHPGLLHTRVAAGAAHPLVALTGLRPGDAVLDATLGMGHDAAFLAGFTGRRVVGVEAVDVVAAWTQEGLRRAGHDVEVRLGESAAVLAAMATGEIDVVVADPMFRDGGDGHNLDALRALATPASLDAYWLAQARRVARKGVLVRDEHPGELLEALGAPVVRARSGRRARYGWWPAAGVDTGPSQPARRA